jgi:hypothetical protein
MKQQRRKPRWLHGKIRDEKSTGKHLKRAIRSNLPIESKNGNTRRVLHDTTCIWRQTQVEPKVEPISSKTGRIKPVPPG